MIALLYKEINSFFGSLIGYVVIIVFLLFNGLFLWVFPMEFNILDNGYAYLDNMFMLSPFIFLFLIPAVTMRTFADEKKRETIELLVTKPLTDLQIVLAKYFACLIIVIVSLIPTLIYYATIYYLGDPVGNIDTGGTIGSYIGLIFLGASFISIGIFASSITDNQIISFLLSILICGFAYLGFEFIYSLDLFGPIDLFIKTLGISSHYTSISRGVVDLRDVAYFLSFISIFILLSKISLESRKW